MAAPKDTLAETQHLFARRQPLFIETKQLEALDEYPNLPPSLRNVSYADAKYCIHCGNLINRSYNQPQCDKCDWIPK